MKDKLEEQLLEAIEENIVGVNIKGVAADFDGEDNAAKECAKISRDYARRFAEFSSKETFSSHQVEGNTSWLFRDNNLITTEKLLTKFDEEIAKNSK